MRQRTPVFKLPSHWLSDHSKVFPVTLQVEYHLGASHNPAILACLPVCRLVLEVKMAQEEAVDNARWLMPLRTYLEAFMEPPEYPTLPDTFKACTSTLNPRHLFDSLHR